MSLDKILEDGYIVTRDISLRAAWKEKCRREGIPYIVVVPTQDGFANIELCVENVLEELAVEVARKWAKGVMSW